MAVVPSAHCVPNLNRVVLHHTTASFLTRGSIKSTSFFKSTRAVRLVSIRCVRSDQDDATSEMGSKVKSASPSLPSSSAAYAIDFLTLCSSLKVRTLKPSRIFVYWIVKIYMRIETLGFWLPWFMHVTRVCLGDYIFCLWRWIWSLGFQFRVVWSGICWMLDSDFREMLRLDLCEIFFCKLFKFMCGKDWDEDLNILFFVYRPRRGRVGSITV